MGGELWLVRWGGWEEGVGRKDGGGSVVVYRLGGVGVGVYGAGGYYRRSIFGIS